MVTLRKARRATIAAVLGAVALLAAGCGASSSGSSAEHSAANVSDTSGAVARAASISGRASGYNMKLTMALSVSALPNPIAATGTGSFSTAARTGSLNLVLNLGSAPQIQALLGSSTLDIRELTDGSTFYVKLPSILTGRLPGGKPWIKLDLAKAAGASGIPGISSLIDNPASSNPAQMLQYLRATSGAVKKVGTAQVNGRTTTEYRATIELRKYPSLVPAAQRGAAQQGVGALESQFKASSIPVTVYVDAENLVRRMHFSLAQQSASTGALAAQFTIDILAYGPQPKPTFPPASQVSNGASLLSQAGSPAVPAHP